MPTAHKLLFLLPLLCGCAQGFNHQALQERLHDSSFQSPDADVKEVRGLKPQLQFPCRVAVYLKPSGDRDWRWTPEDKAALEQWAGPLKQEGIAADVFPLPEILVKDAKADVKELRLAAAKCGADALFVIHGAAQTDSYKNFAAVFNLTVVGGYVVPGSHKDSLFMIEGVLVDVNNGYVYTGIQAEGEGKIIRPTFVIEEKDAVAKAKARAVAQFGDEALKRMRTLAATPPRAYETRPFDMRPVDLRAFDLPPQPQSQSQSQPRPGSDVPAVRPTPGLPPASPTRPTAQNAGGIMTGITAPRPNP